MMRSLRCVAVLLVLGTGPLAHSQSSGKSFDHLSASMRQLIAVTATGSQRYPETDIVAASGLQLGTTVVEDDFKKAARRLGDIGVFADVAYNFSYSSAGTKLVLQVTDNEKFVPVRFEDFVWFPDQELLRRARREGRVGTNLPSILRRLYFFLKYCTARSCCFASALVSNVPRLRRLPVFGSFFFE